VANSSDTNFLRWYRTYDGSCNWLKAGEVSEGEYGTAKSRDYDQHFYADGISKPREGPNPRAVSNAFFRRKKELYYEHTPLLLGLVEFIMHDITWSQDSETEFIEVSMPEDEDDFPRNATMKVWRTEAAPGTGTSKENPRENINRATTWLDLSSLYGSSREVARALRSMKGGKLRTQELQTRGNKKKASYLPFNSLLGANNVPTRTRPGVDPQTLFAGGDPRTNEDWVMMSVHNLFLREHNRLCDILAAKHPEYDDESLYQTVRLLMSGKLELIANAYQMAYFKDMPWPADDGRLNQESRRSPSPYL
jgi:peroxidase